MWRRLIESELHLAPREVMKGPGQVPGAFLIATSSAVWVIECGVGQLRKNLSRGSASKSPMSCMTMNIGTA